MKNLLVEAVRDSLLTFKLTSMILAVAVEEVVEYVALVLEVLVLLGIKMSCVQNIEMKDQALLVVAMVVVTPKAANLVNSQLLVLMIGMIFRLWLLFKSSQML